MPCYAIFTEYKRRVDISDAKIKIHLLVSLQFQVPKFVCLTSTRPWEKPPCRNFSNAMARRMLPFASKIF